MLKFLYMSAEEKQLRLMRERLITLACSLPSAYRYQIIKLYFTNKHKY